MDACNVMQCRCDAHCHYHLLFPCQDRELQIMLTWSSLYEVNVKRLIRNVDAFSWKNPKSAASGVAMAASMVVLFYSLAQTSSRLGSRVAPSWRSWGHLGSNLGGLGVLYMYRYM